MANNNKEIALVTGGNCGIGLEVVRQLARDHGQKFHVLIGCRNPEAGAAAVKELEGEGIGGVEVIHTDITNEESLSAAAKLVGDKFGKLDVLHVNVSSTLPTPMQ
jgi:NAD(P)-dependent dehydrogenase (short-subunit alcohol dehydrogenase family)